MQRRTRQEESIATLGVASLTELLKIPHLANWRA
jgi:hypothetical protein